MIRFALGLALGLVAMWVWTHRNEIGFVVANRDRISGAQKIFEGIGEVGRL